MDSGTSKDWRETMLRGGTICLAGGRGNEVKPLATAEALQGRAHSGQGQRREYLSPSTASLSRPSVTQCRWTQTTGRRPRASSSSLSSSQVRIKIHAGPEVRGSLEISRPFGPVSQVRVGLVWRGYCCFQGLKVAAHSASIFSMRKRGDVSRVSPQGRPRGSARPRRLLPQW